MTLFTSPCTFIAGVASIQSLPPVTYPEVAFIGRSNVGKSSLINALVGQKALARVSQNPGATKQLNFFLLADKLALVDMPGYGFAKVSKAQKSEWDELIRLYLSGRPSLKRVCVLVDARRGVMSPDEEFMTLLDDCAVSFQLVLTKCDMLSEQDTMQRISDTQTALKLHAAAHPDILLTSAAKKIGIETLQEQLAPFAV